MKLVERGANHDIVEYVPIFVAGALFIKHAEIILNEDYFLVSALENMSTKYFYSDMAYRR